MLNTPTALTTTGVTERSHRIALCRNPAIARITRNRLSMNILLSRVGRFIAALACVSCLNACSVTPITATTAAVSGDPRTIGTVFEDERIEKDTHNFFSADGEIASACHINVSSFNQRVLLSGECPTEQLRTEAETYTGQVAKVRQIFNEIVIAAPSTLTTRSSDSFVTTKIKTKLFVVRDLPARNIKVVTESGTVYLMGMVDEASANIAAEVAADSRGVARVVKLFEYPTASLNVPSVAYQSTK